MLNLSNLFLYIFFSLGVKILEVKIDVVEIDTVIGTVGGKCLLTVYFRKSSLMLAFLRESNDSKSVIDVFNYLYDLLGDKNI